MDLARRDFAELIELGHLRPETDLDEFLTFFTVIISGLINQQLANEPGVAFDVGRFSSRTARAIDVLLSDYLPRHD